VATRRLKQRLTAPTTPSSALLRYRTAVLRYLDKVQALVARNPPDLLARLAKLADQMARISPVVARDAQRHARAELRRLSGKPVPASLAGDRAVQAVFVEEQRRLFARLAADIAAAPDAAAAMRLADWRAKLIAGDQTHHVYAEALAAYAPVAGSNRYVWQTRRDERVRPKHNVVHGKSFSWSNPPAVGRHGERLHPGQDYNCRCRAVPVFAKI